MVNMEFLRNGNSRSCSSFCGERYWASCFAWLFRKDRATDFGSNSATLKDLTII